MTPSVQEPVMTAPESFEELIRRVRAGDEDAATELVRTYESAIRRAVRFRLGLGGLGGVVDSMDICQSVMASFFVRAAAGQYELRQPEHLLKLLVTMARNKLAFQTRSSSPSAATYAASHRPARTTPPVAATDASPSRQVSAREMPRRCDGGFRRRSVNWRNGEPRAGVGRDRRAGRRRCRGPAQETPRAVDRVAEELGLHAGEE
jgi:RNA polymerase sigma-70 factor (ECF subfamily)